jgi:hypothetical protein
MTKNTPEAMKKLVENLVVDLYENDDCDNLECEECPFHLKEVEEDPHYGEHTCGWLLLRSATRKIMRK